MPRTFRLAVAAALLFALSLVSGCSENAAWTRGKELLAAGKPAEAAVELRAALKADAENPEIMIDLGKALATTISGETYPEFEGIVAALSTKGKETEVKALEAEAFENGRDAFTGGDHGLAGLAIKFLNAGDKSLELPVLWAMKGNAELIRAHYPTLQMENKAERFAGEISWSADDIAGAEAAIALHEFDKHPAIAENLTTKLNFMLNSDEPQAVALAQKALQSGDFDPQKVLVFFKSAFLNGAPGGPMRKAGFEQILFAASQERPVLYGLGAVVLALVTGWLGGVVFRRA